MHIVQGFLITEKSVKKFKEFNSKAKIIDLESDLKFIPLSDVLLNKISSSASPEIGKAYLYNEMIQTFLKDLSISGKVMYFETEYFGGSGGQCSEVFENGKTISVYSENKSSINDGLKYFGIVVESGSSDEFEAVGLNRFRTTEEWLED
ncbi:hypothetical protein CH370_09680 [Leptospira kmetyi]|uniref:hypothetical protein n=1 Tax=Leptospira kmetyi TaxID=408139 RepID=UPI000C29BADC|nr:hypothetical protein [Leptospira kmetyi]PJZ41699.1 hypothetical protein CH370_09680 [Leptospira kmetyi]